MEYLSDGITENIINNFAQLPKLRVVPRNTVFRYKEREIDPQEIGQRSECARSAHRKGTPTR